MIVPVRMTESVSNQEMASTVSVSTASREIGVNTTITTRVSFHKNIIKVTEIIVMSKEASQ